MCYGNGPNKIKGITLKPKTRWAYSMYICSMIVQGIANMSDHSRDRDVTSHKEEKPSHITSGAKDSNKLRKRLTCIAPLDPYSHSPDLVSVVTGLILPEMVNVHDAVDTGDGQLVSFEKSWPDEFTLLSKLLLTMAVKRMVANFGNNNNVHDTNLIYSRVL